jgi:hypothetical protein
MQGGSSSSDPASPRPSSPSAGAAPPATPPARPVSVVPSATAVAAGGGDDKAVGEERGRGERIEGESRLLCSFNTTLVPTLTLASKQVG